MVTIYSRQVDSSAITCMLMTQLIASTPVDNAQSVVDRPQRSTVDIHPWCASRRLQLNPPKT